jgi:CheY-like chemotaxis protein
VSADPARLGQVVWNLMSNALKFTPRGGSVSVRLFANGAHASIEVADSGQGIAPEFLPRVFDRFSQADSTHTRSHGGLGLGLAIVRHITEQHGGRVSARSGGPNQGSAFRVDLPLRPLSIPQRRGAVLRAPFTHAGTAENILSGVKILAVDDEADARELLAFELTQFGAEVQVASSAEEALSAFKIFAPDVLVSDIGMPREDGLALIHRVRALSFSEGGAVPALALTGYARAEDQREALAQGFQSYLSKPVEPAVLAAEIGQLLRQASGPGRPVD